MECDDDCLVKGQWQLASGSVPIKHGLWWWRWLWW